jgi:alginate O-acetyltransferase complex protein AlgI
LPIWLFAYGWKIYFDFSAYSDIAIGSGRLFGIAIPENFDWPYFRTSITEFWRHWHISLYKWLVDYVFIPLGGSRVSSGKLYRNILLVMLVSGIWHGAGVNYVVWGLWHGIMLCTHRWMLSRREYSRSSEVASPYRKFGGWLATYVGVNLGWAFFAMDMETATLFFKRLVLG